LKIENRKRKVEEGEPEERDSQEEIERKGRMKGEKRLKKRLNVREKGELGTEGSERK
jgi:hypothetical protein